MPGLLLSGVAISALGEATLDELGVDVFTDYLVQLPGVLQHGNEQALIGVRGDAEIDPLVAHDAVLVVHVPGIEGYRQQQGDHVTWFPDCRERREQQHCDDQILQAEVSEHLHGEVIHRREWKQRRRDRDLQIEEVGRRLRGLMSWIDAKEV